MKKGFRISELFCFAVIDDDDIEGVPAIQTATGAMPLVGADMDRVESLKVVARALQVASGKKVRLYRFTGKQEIEWK